jgi:hypothetical protein
MKYPYIRILFVELNREVRQDPDVREVARASPARNRTKLVADLGKCNKELKHLQRHEACACPVLEEVPRNEN